MRRGYLRRKTYALFKSASFTHLTHRNWCSGRNRTRVAGTADLSVNLYVTYSNLCMIFFSFLVTGATMYYYRFGILFNCRNDIWLHVIGLRYRKMSLNKFILSIGYLPAFYIFNHRISNENSYSFCTFFVLLISFPSMKSKTIFIILRNKRVSLFIAAAQ